MILISTQRRAMKARKRDHRPRKRQLPLSLKLFQTQTMILTLKTLMTSLPMTTLMRMTARR